MHIVFGSGLPRASDGAMKLGSQLSLRKNAQNNLKVSGAGRGSLAPSRVRLDKTEALTRPHKGSPP
ncbi:MAG: hypothetical protein ACI89E_000327 [Planctomycetota bacterium]|jgi:hypothetical protein